MTAISQPTRANKTRTTLSTSVLSQSSKSFSFGEFSLAELEVDRRTREKQKTVLVNPSKTLGSSNFRRPRCVSGPNFLSCDDTMGPFFGDTFFRELMRGCKSVSDEIRKK